MSDRRSLERAFPGLARTSYRITSPPDIRYNCIAWAAGDSTRWWWPHGQYWPPNTPEHDTVENFILAFLSLGFVVATDEKYDTDGERVAIYGIEGRVTHMARQIQQNLWTSKLGKDVDVEHELRALEGQLYGTVSCVMAKSETDGEKSDISVEFRH